VKAVYRDIFGNKVRLTQERYSHIIEREELIGEDDKIEETLSVPDVVKLSRYDPNVLLYYKLYESTPVTKKFLTVVTKVMQQDSFILTAFFSDKIKEGETRWEK
jgi:hypothetical protein